MEGIVLCGVQGSGKTTLYRDRFLATHVRVSMDVGGGWRSEPLVVTPTLF